MLSKSATITHTRTPVYQALKGGIHQELLNRLNLDRLTRRRGPRPSPRSADHRRMLDREKQRVPLSLASVSR